MGDFEKFYNSSLRFLSYRPRSEKEIRDYLVRHFEKENRRNDRDSGLGQNDDRESIKDKVIQKLKEQRFINDEEFVKWWIEQRSTFKPRSLRLIKLELRQKGIDKKTINNLQLTINSDLEQAKKLVEKRIDRIKGLPRQEIYQKLGRYLASKGFDWETIKQSIDELVFK